MVLVVIFFGLLFASGQVDGRSVATRAKGERQEASAMTESSLSEALETSMEVPRRRISGIETPLSLAARPSSTKTLGQKRSDGAGASLQVGRISDLRKSCTEIQPRVSNEDQQPDLRPQGASLRPSPSSSIIALEDKNEVWDSIGLVVGIVVAVAFCTALIGVLFHWLSCQRLSHRQSVSCSATGKANHQQWIHSTMSSPSELLVPATPQQHVWPLPQYHAHAHAHAHAVHAYRGSSGTSSLPWNIHHVVSPIDSHDGSTTLQSFEHSPAESLASSIQRPPACYLWQKPVELPATSELEGILLPSYKELQDNGELRRFSWVHGEEASYRPSEKVHQQQ